MLGWDGREGGVLQRSAGHGVTAAALASGFWQQTSMLQPAAAHAHIDIQKQSAGIEWPRAPDGAGAA